MHRPIPVQPNRDGVAMAHARQHLMWNTFATKCDQLVERGRNICRSLFSKKQPKASTVDMVVQIVQNCDAAPLPAKPAVLCPSVKVADIPRSTSRIARHLNAQIPREPKLWKIFGNISAYTFYRVDQGRQPRVFRGIYCVFLL